jgi:3'(2'), 5'-bisphosphate nucleotidase
MRHFEVSQALVVRVLDLAKSAGERIMDVYADMLAPSHESTAALVAHKDDGSPLTRADLLAHQAIAQGLAALTPHIAVVSEEDAQSLVHRLPTGTFWLIDPLDGTKEFLARNGEFTVNIALIQNGATVFGVVLAPVLGQSYWGGVGLGAFRSVGEQVQPVKVTQPGERKQQPLRVVASKSHMNAQTVEFINRLGPHQLIQAGSSLKFCRVAEGAADVYPRLGPTCEWDTAAAQAIVEAAGGSVCELDGRPLRYGKPELLNPHFVASSAPVATWLPPA